MRTIADEYELPEDDGDDYGSRLHHRNWRPMRWVVVLVFVALFGGAIYGLIHATNEQQNDNFCTSCHTAPETTYHDRSAAAVAGALAVDLSSFHYQQIRGQGGTIRCIDCHQGDGSFGNRVETLFLSARNSFTWLGARASLTKTETLIIAVPHLSNAGCVGCHQKTLLVAGMGNHQHNMLPVTYELWRNGGSLIAPEGTKDRQAVIATGLVRYDTALRCSDCHQAHRSLETDMYLDKTVVLRIQCVQCHRDVNKGPLEVTIP